jgi:hypothetical protein
MPGAKKRAPPITTIGGAECQNSRQTLPDFLRVPPVPVNGYR